MSRLIIFITILAVFVGVQNLSYSEIQRFTVKGNAVQIDFVGGAITLQNAVDEMGNLSETETFIVNDDTQITRGTDNIGIQDIVINDYLTVEYYTDENGRVIAVNIIDNNLANE